MPTRKLSTNLDVLRSLAVLVVFIYHILSILRGSYEAINDAAAHFGVVLFFVHTSCVLMGSLESLNPDAPQWAMRFYVRRAFRIYPLSMFIVIFAFVSRAPVAAWVGPAGLPATAKTIAANLLLVQNIVHQPVVSGPMWSLPLEVDMYLVLPLVFLMLRNRRWAPLMAGIWVCAIAGKAAFHADLGHSLGGLLFIPCFLSGALAYRLRKTWTTFRFPAAIWTPGLLVLMVLATAGGFSTYVIWTICLALAFLYASTDDLGINVFTKVCAWIAKYSYGIYLTHAFAVWLAFRVLAGLLHGTGWKVLVTVLITGVATVATFHWIEDPMIRIGKRLSDAIERTALRGRGDPAVELTVTRP